MSETTTTNAGAQTHVYQLTPDLQQQLNTHVKAYLAEGLDSGFIEDLAQSTLDTATIWLKEHMPRYASKHGVKYTKIDPYKVFAWYGFKLAALTQNRRYINFTVVFMQDYLIQTENIEFSVEHLSKLRKVARKDCTHLRLGSATNKREWKSDDDLYAIGANGLYMAFKSALDIKKQVLKGEINLPIKPPSQAM